MSMVKAYHGKRCSELQLCCSSWSMATTLPRVPLTRDIQMEKYETWNWETSLTSNKHRSESKNEMENLKYIPLDPPLEFRDDSIFPTPVEKFAFDFVLKLMSDAFLVSCKITWSIPCSQYCHMSDSLLPNHPTPWNGFRLCWTPELLPNKRLSSLSASHNSLSTISSGNMDDSSYIKSAISHDVLTSKQISDMYNVPFDSDIYAMPVDMVRKKESDKGRRTCESEHYVTTSKSCQKEGKNRKSRSADASAREPIHVTVEEVRGYLHTLYSNDTAGSRSSQEVAKQIKNPFKLWQGNINGDVHTNGLKTKINYIPSGKLKKPKESMDISGNRAEKFKKYRQSFPANFKETLCSIFRIKKLSSPDRCFGRREAESGSDEIGIRLSGHEDLNPPSPISKPPFLKRALPPLPKLSDEHGEIIVTDRKSLPSAEVPSPPPLPFRTKQPSISVDFVSSIEKVKDYGWYWGPITGEAAEKILSNEPDGSFIVRDSSDDYYIFSLTFKLNSIIRHVRIEHDKGNFSFGSSTRFKSHTIVDFIENAVEHSRSGRYLFFLHRRPVLGPMRVQLLHPVSRFKQVQSLQHMCRFVILKMVRRDLIPYLPLPRRVLDYLSTQHYYAEDLLDDDGKGSAREDLEKLLPFRQEVFS